jgi:arabinose-5-phosphate isomerase
MTDPLRSAPRALENRDEPALVEHGRDVIRQEAEALRDIADSLDESFSRAVQLIYAVRGRVLVTGLGKSGLIGRKVAATLTSTGTPALFVHPVEALHGDLGIASSDDLLLAISRSGNNDELLAMHGSLRALGVRSITISCERNSPLARRCDIALITPIRREACPLELSPTTSTTAALAVGDALAMALLRMRGFRREDFAIFHPSGALGRGLRLTVADLMHAGEGLPSVVVGTSLRQALLVIANKRLGCTCVVDGEGRLRGFLTDGDLKRILLREESPLDEPVESFMTPQRRTVAPQCLAREALQGMERNPGGPITQLVVVEDGRPIGVVHIHDILRLGLRSQS